MALSHLGPLCGTSETQPDDRNGKKETVSRYDHLERKEARPVTLWLTGLSGAGKSTLARLIAEQFRNRKLAVEVLDGDIVRQNLSKGLSFSKEDRDTNIRRIGFVANLLGRNGVNVIVAAISPYRSIRAEVRAAQERARFVEVFVDCPLETLVKRDPKGLYKKALSGEIRNFTGVTDPYERPTDSEIIVRTDQATPGESADEILQWLESAALIGKH